MRSEPHQECYPDNIPSQVRNVVEMVQFNLPSAPTWGLLHMGIEPMTIELRGWNTTTLLRDV